MSSKETTWKRLAKMAATAGGRNNEKVIHDTQTQNTSSAPFGQIGILGQSNVALQRSVEDFRTGPGYERLFDSEMKSNEQVTHANGETSQNLLQWLRNDRSHQNSCKKMVKLPAALPLN